MDSNAITPLSSAVAMRPGADADAPLARDQREAAPIQTLRATPVVEGPAPKNQAQSEGPALETILERLAGLRENGGPALSFEKVAGERPDEDVVLLREEGEEVVLREITQEELRELAEKLDRFQAAAEILRGLFLDEEA